MNGDVEVKVCGISTPDVLESAIAAGAAYAGFVFFTKSPRNVSIADAGALCRQADRRLRTVALTVDADDALIASIVDGAAPDWLQLHGHETPERAAAVRVSTGRAILKAIGVATTSDAEAALAYIGAADMILFDAKPPASASVPGGNGVAFDWKALEAVTRELDRRGMAWMLSGGLTAGTVAEAVGITGATRVDVSSGVESAPGVKSPALIAAFIAATRSAPQAAEAARWRA